MELNQRELKAMYVSLKEMCSNVDCDSIPMFRQGSRLVPRCKMEVVSILRRRIEVNLQHPLRKQVKVYKSTLVLYLIIPMLHHYKEES